MQLFNCLFIESYEVRAQLSEAWLGIVFLGFLSPDLSNCNGSCITLYMLCNSLYLGVESSIINGIYSIAGFLVIVISSLSNPLFIYKMQMFDNDLICCKMLCGLG